MSEPLPNGHDKTELVPLCAVDVAGDAAALRQQVEAVRYAAGRHSERTTIESLALDAVRRLAEAYKAGDWQRAAEITREICRLEVYLSKRGLV